ncbi:heterokaryon incompatibility protein-domain-containing protein [Paraphoma chrysanthemicola]|uniref:Heterokaryon incompatibility protein-domain-containing protein n=1 Tax=Paraphoma chrysanthemicola TaxID=798071 RepID=A0A8K0VWY6_9PLEO|nr:heterokaryon incompatibility protein-domain-containing protein [Paraphoma chrysanthemicola]
MQLFSIYDPDGHNGVGGRKYGVRIQADTANLQKVQQWLWSCEMEHQSESWTCFPRQIPDSVFEILRIIDCRTRLIRPLASGESYICLSYVWGTSAAASLRHGSTLVDELPKTIEDAIHVAKFLGTPQLWVDQCCIDQNDDHARAATIRSMDKIYGCASLTIIAASSGDAFGGLPGVRGTPRKQPYSIRIGSVDFVASTQSRNFLQRSRWATRGWTYQEGLLSHRRLIFTDEQVYFQCGKEFHIEKLVSAVTLWTTGLGNTSTIFPTVYFDVTSIIYTRLKEYFIRQLSYGTDSLAAFEGVINAHSHDESLWRPSPKHFYGIPIPFTQYYDSEFSPTKHLSAGLSWALTKPGAEQDRLHASDATVARIPTWSWAWPKSRYCTKGNELMVSYCTPNRWTLCDSIEVSVRHKNGDEYNLDNIGRNTTLTDYSEFMAHIDITTHVIYSTSNCRSAIAELFETSSEAKWSASFFPDETVFQDGGEAIAIWLGQFVPLGESPVHGTKPKSLKSSNVFLVCRENIGQGTYRRVGLWVVHDLMCDDSRPSKFLEVKDVISRHLRAGSEIQYWGLKEVRLV